MTRKHLLRWLIAGLIIQWISSQLPFVPAVVLILHTASLLVYSQALAPFLSHRLGLVVINFFLSLGLVLHLLDYDWLVIGQVPNPYLHWLLSLLVPAITILATQLLFKRPIPKQLSYALSGLIVLGFIVVTAVKPEIMLRPLAHAGSLTAVGGIVYLVLSIRLTSQEKRHQAEQQQLGLIEQYLETVRDWQRSQRWWRHDVKNHLAILEQLAKPQVDDYLKEVEQALATPDNVLAILIAEKTKYAREFGIDFQFEADPNITQLLKPTDVTGLYGNLFDNAIKAARMAGSTVFGRTWIDRGMIHLELENDSQPVMIVANRVVRPDQSGNGLDIIEFIVQNYHGHVDYSYKNGRFKVTIALYRL